MRGGNRRVGILTVKFGDQTRLQTVAIRVKNRDAMIAFYRDIIGFGLKREENELAIMGIPTPRNESLWLEESPRAEDFFGEVKKLKRLCLVIPSEEELADLLFRIEKKGYPFEDALYDEGVMGFLVNDPEGNQLEIYFGSTQRDGVHTPQPLNRDKLLSKARGNYPMLSDGAFFDKVHLNTADVAAETSFLQEVLGFRVKDETGGMAVLNNGHFHVGLSQAQGGTVALDTAKVLGLDFLRFHVTKEEMTSLASHLEGLNQEFFINKGQTILTIYDPTGIEWWFTTK